MKLFTLLRKKRKVTREQFIAQEFEKAILDLFKNFVDPKLQDDLSASLKRFDLEKELKRR